MHLYPQHLNASVFPASECMPPSQAQKKGDEHEVLSKKEQRAKRWHEEVQNLLDFEKRFNADAKKSKYFSQLYYMSNALLDMIGSMCFNSNGDNTLQQYLFAIDSSTGLGVCLPLGLCKGPLVKHNPQNVVRRLGLGICASTSHSHTHTLTLSLTITCTCYDESKGTQHLKIYISCSFSDSLSLSPALFVTFSLSASVWLCADSECVYVVSDESNVAGMVLESLKSMTEEIEYLAISQCGMTCTILETCFSLLNGYPALYLSSVSKTKIYSHAHSLILSLVSDSSYSHPHTLPITCTCCYDEIKGAQDQDFSCSFSDSLSHVFVWALYLSLALYLHAAESTVSLVCLSGHCISLCLTRAL